MKYFDNVRVNHKFNGIFFLIYFLFFIKSQSFIDSLGFATISIIIYALSSAYFQPDLDQKHSRPGKSTFPSKLLLNKKYPFYYIFYPINRAWYWLWAPYGRLFTHRGISHWPILGTYTRVFYLYPVVFIIPKTAVFFNLFLSLDFSIFWVVVASPIFLSDFMHFLVDFADSLRKNTPFCSFAQEPGILLKMVDPKAMKYHRKGLRGSKRKAKKDK